MQRHKPKKKRTGLKIFLGILIVLLVAGGAYAYSVIQHVNKAINSVHKPIERTPEVKRPSELSLDKKEPFSVLLLGVDQRPGDKGRSDTMVVVTVNPNDNSMIMVSLPRDTRVPIVGRGTEDKIAHAYAYGGVEMSMNTVERFLDIPIDYYVKVNMQGFKDIVNAVGGVTVNNDMEFSANGYHFPKGTIDLDGDAALAFVRMRKQDPRGDFGRQKRQREVIENILRKGVNVQLLWRYDEILSALGNNVETNLTLEEMLIIQRNYVGALNNITEVEINGKPEITNRWYYVVSEEERTRISNMLKEHLEL